MAEAGVTGEKPSEEPGFYCLLGGTSCCPADLNRELDSRLHGYVKNWS